MKNINIDGDHDDEYDGHERTLKPEFSNSFKRKLRNIRPIQGREIKILPPKQMQKKFLILLA